MVEMAKAGRRLRDEAVCANFVEEDRLNVLKCRRGWHHRHARSIFYQQ